jgi:hypothetical protein
VCTFRRRVIDVKVSPEITGIPEVARATEDALVAEKKSALLARALNEPE